MARVKFEQEKRGLWWVQVVSRFGVYLGCEEAGSRREAREIKKRLEKKHKED